jgi:AcrR family transcriptional regulator
VNKETENPIEQVILETAEVLFLDKGFALTSTTEIARKAGCNQALVHYYFRTKDRLFEIVFEKYATMLTSALYQMPDEDVSFEENVRKKTRTLFDLMTANPKMPFLLFNELITNPVRQEFLKAKIGDLPRSYLEKLECDLKAEIEKGAVRPMSATDLLLTILSLNLGLFLAGPVLAAMTGTATLEFQKILENRKRENITIILKSLHP